MFKLELLKTEVFTHPSVAGKDLDFTLLLFGEGESVGESIFPPDQICILLKNLKNLYKIWYQTSTKIYCTIMVP